MSWTDERIEQLREMWGQGQSAAKIGEILGVSKNAVIGKAHRMKLPSRPSPIKRERKVKKAAPETAKEQKKARPETVKPKPKLKKEQKSLSETQPKTTEPKVKRTVPKIQLTRDSSALPPIGFCQWPVGHPGEPGFHFCGCAALTGKPYCGDHYSIAYMSSSRRS